MTKDVITLRGDRKKWLEFVYALKRQKKEVWQTIEPFIDGIIKEAKHGRK